MNTRLAICLAMLAAVTGAASCTVMHKINEHPSERAARLAGKAPVRPASSRYVRGPSVERVMANYGWSRQVTDRPRMDLANFALCRGPSYAAKAHDAPPDAGFRVFMNAEARSGAETKTYPMGSVIVKEKVHIPTRVSPTKTEPYPIIGIAGMIKRSPGFDPEHGDWEYFYREKDGPVDQGRLANCAECHSGGVVGKGYKLAGWDAVLR